jgi:ABC-type uncharacterized transport system substrate-binding protein
MTETSVRVPETINKLRSAADAAFAMLAGMQLDVFINLKAAKQIGLTIPVRVLERANQVIR